MSLANVFKEAKKHLIATRYEQAVPQKYMYICNALEQLKGTCQHRIEDIENAQYIINERLAPERTLENWLENTMHIVLDASDELFVKMQVTRQAWLDSLVKEFSDVEASTVSRTRRSN